MIVAYSLVDRTCVTAIIPVIATSAMAEKKLTSKQTASGCRCKQNVGMSRRNYHKHDQAPVSLYNRHGTFLTTESAVAKKQGKRRSEGVAALGQARACAKGGGVLYVCAEVWRRRGLLFDQVGTVGLSHGHPWFAGLGAGGCMEKGWEQVMHTFKCISFFHFSLRDVPHLQAPALFTENRT